MNLNSYLEKIADGAIIRDEEKSRIINSITTLKLRLKDYFDDSVDDMFVFGSYSRDTILPRNMDQNSDIDYMVVFNINEHDTKIQTPQTYLRKLREFAETKYSTSEIYQSNPTIVLALNHIYFELVPSIKSIFSLEYKIPGKDYASWIATDPKSFNEELTRINQHHKNQIRKLIRVVKYWNVLNDGPFESFELEQKICRFNFSYRQLFGGLLKDYLFDFIMKFEVNSLKSKKQFNAVLRAQKLVKKAYDIEERQKNQHKSVLPNFYSCFSNPDDKSSVEVISPLLSPTIELKTEMFTK